MLTSNSPWYGLLSAQRVGRNRGAYLASRQPEDGKPGFRYQHFKNDDFPGRDQEIKAIGSGVYPQSWQA